MTLLYLLINPNSWFMYSLGFSKVNFQDTSVFHVYNNVCMCCGYSCIHFMKKTYFQKKKSKSKVCMFTSPQINCRHSQRWKYKSKVCHQLFKKDVSSVEEWARMETVSINLQQKRGVKLLNLSDKIQILKVPRRKEKISHELTALEKHTFFK